MKFLAFAIGVCIFTFGGIGMVMPSALVWVAQRFDTPVDWYAVGAIRVGLGALLLVVAKTSRAPRILRVVAFVPILAGLAALATPLVALERARATLEWWSGLESGYIRLSVIPVLLLGGFIAYACAPARRAVAAQR